MPIRETFLGLLQGVSEFFPISSSGHLVLGGGLLERLSPTGSHLSIAEIILYHAGTLVAVLLVLRAKLIALLRALLGDAADRGEPVRLAALLVVSVLGTAVCAGPIKVVPGLEEAGAVFGKEDIERIIGMERVLGVAEVMDYYGAINNSERMREILDLALENLPGSPILAAENLELAWQLLKNGLPGSLSTEESVTVTPVPGNDQVTPTITPT